MPITDANISTKYARWGLRHNPFTPLAPVQDYVRRAVFTGHENHLTDLLDHLVSARSCCIFGTYGMGKTFLMLESRACLREKYPDVLPVYERVLPRQAFEITILDGLSKALRQWSGETSGTWVDPGLSVVTRVDKGEIDPLLVIRDLVGKARASGIYPAFLIDDVDRFQDVTSVKSMIDTTRELNNLECSIVLPGNPDNLTRRLRTAGQGLFDTVVLDPFSPEEYKRMIMRYLETARGDCDWPQQRVGGRPLIFLCCAQEDNSDVIGLYDRLQLLGYRPWTESRDIPAGADRQFEIDEAIRTASFFIACLSKNSIDRRGVIQKQLREALDRVDQLLRRDIFLIPVRFDDSPVPEVLRRYQPINIDSPLAVDQLHKSFREGLRRRVSSLPIGKPESGGDLSLNPFEDGAIAAILAKMGIEGATPRLLVRSCSILLGLAADQQLDTITEKFVRAHWNHIGGSILADEEHLERLIAILQELAERGGHVDEDIDLQSLRKMLDGNPGRFINLVQRIEGAEDIFIVKEKDGMTNIELSPLISATFVKDILMKSKLDEFRRKYLQGESPVRVVKEWSELR
jgi:hypothetical protein